MVVCTRQRGGSSARSEQRTIIRRVVGASTTRPTYVTQKRSICPLGSLHYRMDAGMVAARPPAERSQSAASAPEDGWQS